VGSIAIDSHGSRIYWAKYSIQSQSNQIRRVDLDGSNIEDLIATTLGGTALDLPPPIPALSEWGVVVLLLSLLTLGLILIRRARVVSGYGCHATP